MKSKILIIAGMVLVSACLGFAVPVATGASSPGLQVDRVKLKKQAIEQFKMDIQRMYEDDQNEQIMNQLRTQVADARGKLTKLTQGTATKIEAEFSAKSGQIIGDANSVEKATAKVQAQNDAKLKSAGFKQSTIESAISKNKDKISDADLKAGKAYYNSVDTEYLSKLMEGGMTPEKDQQLQAYLHARFSDADYEQAKALYYKYVYLLNQNE